jgi:hypothetical protein
VYRLLVDKMDELVLKIFLSTQIIKNYYTFFTKKGNILANLFTRNSNNTTINNLYLDISKNILFPLNILKEALLNPNKKLFLERCAF